MNLKLLGGISIIPGALIVNALVGTLKPKPTAPANRDSIVHRTDSSNPGIIVELQLPSSADPENPSAFLSKSFAKSCTRITQGLSALDNRYDPIINATKDPREWYRLRVKKLGGELTLLSEAGSLSLMVLPYQKVTGLPNYLQLNNIRNPRATRHFYEALRKDNPDFNFTITPWKITPRTRRNHFVVIPNYTLSRKPPNE